MRTLSLDVRGFPPRQGTLSQCLCLNKGNFSSFEILGHVAFVPISGWKRWEELAEQDGAEGPVNLLPKSVAGAVVTYLT